MTTTRHGPRFAPTSGFLVTASLLFVATATASILLFLQRPRSRFDLKEPLPTLAGVHTSLSAIANSEDYRLEPGEVAVGLTIENRSQQEIMVYTRGGPEVAVVTVRDASGWPASRIRDRPWYTEFNRRSRSSVSSFLIARGAKSTLPFVISRSFDMTEPGAYQVAVSNLYRLRDPPHTFYRTDAAPITVTVQ